MDYVRVGGAKFSHPIQYHLIKVYKAMYYAMITLIHAKCTQCQPWSLVHANTRYGIENKMNLYT